MAEKISRFYPHRQNRDGSFDSICMNCFAIVASAKAVTELRSYTTEHVCSTMSQPIRRPVPLDQVPALSAERADKTQPATRGPLPARLKWQKISQAS